MEADIEGRGGLLMSNQCLSAFLQVSSNLRFTIATRKTGALSTHGCVRLSHPDDTGRLEHDPSPLHAGQLAPFLVGGVCALYGFIHLFSPTGHQLTQDTA